MRWVVPFLQGVFQTEPLGPTTLLAGAGVALVMLAVMEAEKALRRKTHPLVLKAESAP